MATSAEHLAAQQELERKTAELSRSAALLRAVLGATTDGILVTEDAGKITSFNDRLAEIWRVPREVLAAGDNRRLLEMAAEQSGDPPAFLARIAEIYETSPPETYDLLELADGRAIERSTRPLVLDEQRIGCVWSFREVTERMRAEEMRARLAAIVESSHDAIVSKTLDGVIRSWNAEAERLFGHTAEEAIGQSILLIIPPERQDEEREIMERLRRGERVEHFETVRLTKDGRRIDLSLTISPIRNAAGRVIGASKVARDITDRKRTDEALREADRRKDEFLALLAHELRNPLAPLRNGLEIIRLAGTDANAVSRARAMMERQLAHMVRLVDDLLDVSRISRNKIELRRARILLSDVLSSAVETARPAIEAAEHELSLALPPTPIHLDADLTRLAQVFSNLLNNSAKYTPRGGRIRLTAERRGDQVAVSVTDTGIGIPADALPHIFEMFSQVDRSIERATGGLGIGLALVKGLVEMHGGTVTAESAGPGKGSTFTVRLPVLEESLDPGFPETPEREADAGRPKRRILVAEDNRDTASSMAMILKLAGNEVHAVHDGAEAVAAAERFRPEVILMDVGMPRLNGYEATRRIREQPWGRDIVIVALTGWGQPSDKSRSQEAGCDAHLVKPVKMSELEDLLTSEMRTPTGSSRHRS